MDNFFINYHSIDQDQNNNFLIENPFTNFKSYEDMYEEITTPEYKIIHKTPYMTSLDLPTTSVEYQHNTSSNKENISLEELIKEENLPIKITSGFRGSNSFRGGRTAKGTRSNHNRVDEHGHSMAYDIVPINRDFNDLKKIIYNNKRLLKWLDDRGYGILDESNPETMKKTGATGKHFHIGPDSSALAEHKQNKDRFTMMARVGGILRMQNGGQFVSYTPTKSRQSSLEDPSKTINADINIDRILNQPKSYEQSGFDISNSSISDVPDGWDIPKVERSLNQQRQTTANRVMQNSREEFKQRLIRFIKEHEGIGLHNVKGDKGGLTNTGITLSTFKSYGTDKNQDGKIDEKDLAKLNNTDWENIFTKNFWDKVGGDKIKDERILGQLVDWTWMSGGNAIKKARKALGLPESLIVDNQMIDIINNNPEDSLNKIKQARLNHYTSIVEHNPSQSKFLKGWVKRVNDLV